MNITVFLEGSPGHEKQSIAVIRELQHMVDVNVDYVALEKKTVVQKILKISKFIICSDGGCSYHLSSPDLLLGTGTNTHIELLAAKKKYKIPAVVCMAPDPIYRRYFDLCFVPRHDGLPEGQNIFLTDGPPVPTAPSPQKTDKKGLILIGGPNAYSSAWGEDTINGYVNDIVSTQKEIEWTLSTSPRTPVKTAESLESLAEKNRNLNFFHYRDTPKGWVEERYAESGYTWVTVDSMSMIYEALTAGCKVGLLPLEWKKKNNKFSKGMETLIAKELAVNFHDWKSGKIAWQNRSTFNEAKRCAEEILRRWVLKS